MALFRKKRDEEEEDDPSFAEASDGKGEFSKRRFKDLKPQNKRKRKEPPKPWGKKERLMVLIVFLTTIIAAAIMAGTARGYKLLSVERINFRLPSFDSLNIFKEETIIVEKKQ